MKKRKTMKKLLMAILLLGGITSGACARDGYFHDASVLPQTAQTILTKSFPSQVSFIKEERSFGRVSEYEVTLDDGTEVSFDRNGNWESVETKRSGSVPSELIPDAIAKFIADRHAGQAVIGIERDRRGYEIELSSGLDIHFDSKGAFVRYDD